MEPIKHLKARQPLGKLQRKILFVMIHTPDPNELFPTKMAVRDIADKIYGKNNHTPVNRKVMIHSLKSLRKRRLTDFTYLHEQSFVVGQWWLTAQGRALNIRGMIAYWKDEDPVWFQEVTARLTPFFTTLEYDEEVVE